MLPPPSVIIADGHRLYRRQLSALFANHGIQVLGMAASFAELTQLLQTHRPIVIIMELRLPDYCGIELCHYLRQHYPAIGRIVVTSCSRKPLMKRMLDSGAQAYLVKNTMEEEDLVTAINEVAGGGTFFCRECTSLLTGGQDTCPLTPEQQELLRQVCGDKKSWTIAHEYSLSKGAVDKRRKKLMEACNALSLIDLAKFGLQWGILDWSEWLE